jgi:hypothetical protein
VRPREGPGADLAVGLERRRLHQLDFGRSLRVPELADIEVLGLPVDGDDALPAEQDVGRGLHQPLAFDDALPVLIELACAQEGLEHRGLRLFELEKERVVLVAAEQEQDPGRWPSVPS